MYAAVEPGCKDTLKEKTLSLEVPRPLGVVRDDENLLVRHRAEPTPPPGSRPRPFTHPHA